MIYEGNVIKNVMSYLKNDGYEIISYCLPDQQGHDIVARKEDIYIYVEAKGQTSSKKYTQRYGKEFKKDQKMDHVSKALYKALKTKNEVERNSEIAIALPSDKVHRQLISDIIPSLKQLKIIIFFVNNEGNVDVL